MKKLFFKDGEVRGTLLLIVFSALTIVGISFLAPEIITSFTHRFGRSGIWQILGPAAGVTTWYFTMKKYDIEQDGSNASKGLIFGALLFWAGLFGPNVGFKQDREDSIPDTNVYYNNGKVINAIDSTKDNYYFKEFKLTPVDSEYIVKYGEEPGYNFRMLVSDSNKSITPRANEAWKRPVTKNAQKFVDGKRNK